MSIVSTRDSVVHRHGALAVSLLVYGNNPGPHVPAVRGHGQEIADQLDFALSSHTGPAGSVAYFLPDSSKTKRDTSAMPNRFSGQQHRELDKAHLFLISLRISELQYRGTMLAQKPPGQ